MTFEHPELLWLLLVLVPLMATFLWWAWVVKRRLILKFVQSRLLANLTVGVSTGRQQFRMLLLLLATSALLLAIARPQWGFDWEEARQRGLDILVAIDTSRSMLADDVAPNRLRRAKLAALDLKKLARTDRLGVIAFAGSAFLQCPLSIDDDAFRHSIEALDVNIIPQGGTALAEAIRTARSAFKEKNDNHKILVIFTDGEDHDGEALETARVAAKEGLRIFTIGVGSKNGELLRVTDAQGRTDFIKDNQGQVVKSRLNEQLLQQIAQSSQGFYMILSGVNTMDLLYERGLAPLPKSEFASRRLKRFHERFQWFLGFAILILVVEMLFPERKRVRRSEAILAGGANAELRKAVAVLVLLMIPVLGQADSPSRALKKYQSGNYAASQLEYERALKDRPNDPRLQYNAGVAAFQAHDYENAQSYLQSALLTPDLTLQQKTYYNLGNTQYRQGEQGSEPAAKQQAWEEAVNSYEGALKLNPRDSDAQYNLELVKKKLEALKQQQQQQKQDQGKDDKKDEEKNGQQDKKEQQDKSQQDKSKQEQGKKEEQQKQENSKPEQDQSQQKPEEQKNQSGKPEQDKDKQGEKGQANPENKDKNDQPPAQEGNQTPVIQMTPEQAKQLLDVHKGEERPLIFIPPNAQKRPNRIFKDW